MDLEALQTSISMEMPGHVPLRHDMVRRRHNGDQGPFHMEVMDDMAKTTAGGSPALLEQPFLHYRPRTQRAKLVQLQRLGIDTPLDLLLHLPRDYEDRSDVIDIGHAAAGQLQTFRGVISEVVDQGRGRQTATLYAVRDGRGLQNVRLGLTWFGQSYLSTTIHEGDLVQATGTVENFRGRLGLTRPEFDVVENRIGRYDPVNTGRVVPIYRLTSGMTQDFLRRQTREALAHFGDGLHRSRPGTPPGDLHRILSAIHWPDTIEAAHDARLELAADEVLEMQLALLARRHHREQSTVRRGLSVDPKVCRELVDRLPFDPTTAQLRCMDEIRSDLRRDGPAMNRLLQGEVGSGKTLVALGAAVDVASAGGQTALLAPTEVLAEQHLATIAGLLRASPGAVSGPGVVEANLSGLDRPFATALLTGSTRAAARRSILERLAQGQVDLLIGTHAIIQNGVDIPHLELAIADEQHRFGVEQRAVLRRDAHYLMLTATSIPRTMQLTLYRDLDISTIDEMPDQRLPVTTHVLDDASRNRSRRAVEEQVAQGRQAFVVLPFIDANPDFPAHAAAERFPVLRDRIFPDLRVGMIHGRMKAREQDRMLRAFRDGDIDVMVATSIIEVGIDVPNATVMVIDSAERFGLAQLHQFRGRVGRGEHPGVCYVMTTPGVKLSPEAQSRLQALGETTDGMALAERDLRTRGHGDIAGTRQSGHDRLLRTGSIYTLEMLEKERVHAEELHARDPELALPDHARLRTARGRMLARMDQVGTDH